MHVGVVQWHFTLLPQKRCILNSFYFILFVLLGSTNTGSTVGAGTQLVCSVGSEIRISHPPLTASTYSMCFKHQFVSSFEY